jgi:hypothetical protein
VGAGIWVLRSVNKSIHGLVDLYASAAAEHQSIFSQHENALKEAVKTAIQESILVTRPATSIEQKHGR